MRCRERASRFRARVDTGNTLPRPALRIRGSTPPGRTGPWRRWQRQAFRRTMRALLSLERVEGIEPSSKAWEAFVLPLNYTRVRSILRRFPPPRNRAQGRVAIAAGQKCSALPYRRVTLTLRLEYPGLKCSSSVAWNRVESNRTQRFSLYGTRCGLAPCSVM